MKIHAIETGKVAVHERQREGSGPVPFRLINTLLIAAGQIDFRSISGSSSTPRA